MITLLRHLSKNLKESFRYLIPIFAVIGVFQLLVLQQPIPNIGNLIAGFILVVIGLFLFFYRLETGLLPTGEKK